MRTFEEKTEIVASAFYNRFEDEGEPEILQKIFETHDMSGVIALALINGDIELKTEAPRKWLEETYDVLNALFNFPENFDDVEVDEPKPKAKTPRKKVEEL